MKILLKMTLLVAILFGIYNVALESLRFSRDQVRILNAKALSKSLQFYYLQQGTYPPSGLNENVCYYLYNRKLINKPMRDPAYMSNVIFLEKNLYLVKKFLQACSPMCVASARSYPAQHTESNIPANAIVFAFKLPFLSYQSP